MDMKTEGIELVKRNDPYYDLLYMMHDIKNNNVVKCNNCDITADIHEIFMYSYKEKPYCHICSKIEHGVDLDEFYIGVEKPNILIKERIKDACLSFEKNKQMSLCLISRDENLNLRALYKGDYKDYLVCISVKEKLDVVSCIYNNAEKRIYYKEKIINLDFSSFTDEYLECVKNIPFDINGAEA